MKQELKEEFDSANTKNSIKIKLKPDEDLTVISASGPYMSNNTILANHLELLVDVVKAKNAHVLILVSYICDLSSLEK